MLLTQKQAAAQLQVSVKTLQRMRNAGELEFIQWGYNTIRISQDSIDRFQRRHTKSLPAQAGEESAASVTGQFQAPAGSPEVRP